MVLETERLEQKSDFEQVLELFKLFQSYRANQEKEKPKKSKLDEVEESNPYFSKYTYKLVGDHDR